MNDKWTTLGTISHWYNSLLVYDDDVYGLESECIYKLNLLAPENSLIEHKFVIPRQSYFDNFPAIVVDDKLFFAPHQVVYMYDFKTKEMKSLGIPNDPYYDSGYKLMFVKDNKLIVSMSEGIYSYPL
ncbi:hypothetical protein LJC44_00375 [Parabacteroides sp. OttesenSCG-928-G06]|nr:hypothetical protein [Parabacteroides sp. OttesenSCG-928-G06]